MRICTNHQDYYKDGPEIFPYPFLRLSAIRNGFGVEYLPYYEEGGVISVNFNIDYTKRTRLFYEFHREEIESVPLFNAELWSDDIAKIQIFEGFRGDEDSKSRYLPYLNPKDKEKYHEWCESHCIDEEENSYEYRSKLLSHSDMVDEIVEFLRGRIEQRYVNLPMKRKK